MTREAILTEALAARNDEIFGYQINIDNYRLAIAKIKAEYPDDQDLAVFRRELEERLAEECRQQRRAMVIRDVIADQLEESR